MDDIASLQSYRERLPRRLAAIAFLDVAGYSRLMGRDDEATIVGWANVCDGIILPLVDTWGGRLIDEAGDGLFLEFSAALDAMRWAMAVQKQLALRQAASICFQVRIALHLADVVHSPNGKIQGDGVNVAARLQSVAKPGGIVISQSFANAVQGRMDLDLNDIGQQRLKNIAYPVRVFEIGIPGQPRNGAPRRALVALALLAALVVPRGWAVQNPGPGTSREQALVMLREGRAIPCKEYPCPLTWLARRAKFEGAIERAPDIPELYAEATFTYTNFVASELSLNRADDLRRAEMLATRATALAPDNPTALEARAAVLRQFPDRIEAALTAYMRSLAIKPSQPSVMANAGFMLILLGRFDEAEPIITSALQSAPTHAGAPSWMNHLGLIHLFTGRYESSVAWFRRAIDGIPGKAAADTRLMWRLNLASALALQGDLDAARSVINEVRQEHPVVSTHNLGTCDCSHAASFLAAQRVLRGGLLLAGLVE